MCTDSKPSANFIESELIRFIKDKNFERIDRFVTSNTSKYFNNLIQLEREFKLSKLLNDISNIQTIREYNLEKILDNGV